MDRRGDNPMVTGAVFAGLAAIAFGLTTPLIKRFGEGVGAFGTAALLYGGAAAASIAARAEGEASVRRAHVPRLVAVAILGAVLAPVALAWGLQRTSATTASLLLNLEAVFTVLLARAVYGEPVGRRVGVAVTLMAVAGVLLVARGGASREAGSAVGAVAVLAASFGWAADNTLTRPLADLDPARVVLWKGGLGAALSAAVAVALGERAPAWGAALALVACGAVGYGLSLRLYLQAQRRIGAARTGSIFAVAPFVGAAVAWAMGDRAGGAVELAAGAILAGAVYLHLTERHEHAHAHDALEHEHAHRHDDGHHTHAHDPPFAGEHSHPHGHEAMAHDHPHGIDVHHRHPHE
ncbi:MAG TPA: EamA family transporter [Polyangiaceae bacterium]|nr:EamA family transporter [Polyangiaceae bacterium]